MAGYFRRSLVLFSSVLCLLFTLSLVHNMLHGEPPGSGKSSWIDMSRVSSSGESKASEFNSATVDDRWMSWSSSDPAGSPGKYRSCVPYPQSYEAFYYELTGGMVGDDNNMTILGCLEHCISLEFTYAAITKGTQCYCTNVYKSSNLLSYADSSLCNIPCAGETKYDCGGKEHFSLYRTSVPDPRCCNVMLGAVGAYPLIALASYPRSGNTWTRLLIQQASGVYTGSIYGRAENKKAIAEPMKPGAIIHYKSKRTICIKTHKFQMEHIKEFEAAVLLIRNPYRTLVAEVYRRFKFERNGSMTDSMEYFKTAEWQQFVKREGKRWHQMNLNWIKNTKRLLVIHYEHLERDTVAQLSRIVQFLDPSKLDQDRVSCAVQDNPSSLSTGIALNSFGQRTRTYLTSDPFTPSMHPVLDAFILSVNDSLKARNLDVLPAEHYGNVNAY